MTCKHIPYYGLHALIHESLVNLKDSCNRPLSHEGYFVYSQLYLKYGRFYHSVPISLEEIHQTFNYSKLQLQEVLTELKAFNLICEYGKRDEVLRLELIPPPPLSLMRGTVLSKDIGYNRYLVLGDIFLIEGDEEFAPLKYHFIHLDTNEYDQLIEATETGNCLYFIAEAVQLIDGSWRLRNECNMMTQYPQA